LDIKYTDGPVGDKKPQLNISDIKIHEKIGNKLDSVDINELEYVLKLAKDTVQISEIHFLADVSKAVSNQQLDTAVAKIISSIFATDKRISKQKNTDFYLSTFSDALSKKPQNC